MGIESFYLNLIDKSSKYNICNLDYCFRNARNKRELEFVNFMESNGYKMKQIRNIKNKFSIDNLIYITVLTDEDYFQGVSFEGCFSCYEVAMKYFIDLSVIINKSFCNMKICKKNNVYINDITKKSLTEYINSVSLSRKEFFDCQYSCSFISLPGIKFYKKYKVYTLLHFIKKKI